ERGGGGGGRRGGGAAAGKGEASGAMDRPRAEEKTARRETQRAPRRIFGFACPQRRRRVRPGVASRRSNAKRTSMGGGPPARPRLHGKTDHYRGSARLPARREARYNRPSLHAQRDGSHVTSGRWAHALPR